MDCFRDRGHLHSRFAYEIVLRVRSPAAWLPCCAACATRQRSQTLRSCHSPAVSRQARQRLKSLPSLVDVTIPGGKDLTVCGDVHGQFYDLLNIFKINGKPSSSNPYLFNGALRNPSSPVQQKPLCSQPASSLASHSASRHSSVRTQSQARISG